ncbi:ribosome biogenesis GTP-binding protein YihA/YsxC [Clostridium cochlearium]|uniref:Probable GTP-binding protein EngB n=1 Tax=Clostridium cochlearium TaxID=1494 RepID=A0A240AV81_CLOCO|nr:ribosome biogenesis GTP-binding protein YihA/YsxC [Clostridium cochlearium]MBV1818890.1 ribosome biogenesis GTP-binding protein YihA/YsxC [Bacteroidales bacterium MSK.15.36]NSJ91158.1 YihA family ribosome biogenesis GTP-binding protein [Coprococcus sp. MSK.21.13]MBE6065852.1 YihA family ribosome biogenesis GTP-binding protein [Clostridium cochlearium]MBU5268642.1 ribosome biogenesis GTP-binding protein YihA/YsxC [Clostridium cochlearium]MCG4571643.1 ribosome biogenesis GTP-binding protein Y
MEIKQSEFITSAKIPSQYPEDDRIEIAFVGRSNVGKSSLINSLTNRRKLVKVSSKPGKTRLINFFLINNDFYFVDLPGYGYARVSKEEKKNWGKTIETYLTDREQLKKIILLVDSRHKPTNDDILMCNWIKYYGYDLSVVATKSDKLKRSEFKKNEKIIRDTLDLSKDNKIIFYSTLNKSGREELLQDIFNTCSID